MRQTVKPVAANTELDPEIRRHGIFGGHAGEGGEESRIERGYLCNPRSAALASGVDPAERHRIVQRRELRQGRDRLARTVIDQRWSGETGAAVHHPVDHRRWTTGQLLQKPAQRRRRIGGMTGEVLGCEPPRRRFGFPGLTLDPKGREFDRSTARVDGQHDHERFILRSNMARAFAGRLQWIHKRYAQA